jgi:hypothetical protein
MIVDEPARIRYYQGDALQYESRALARSASGVRVRWMEPEGPHSVENIDQRRYHAIRVELKEHPSHDRPPEADCVDRAGPREQKEQRNVIPR